MTQRTRARARREGSPTSTPNPSPASPPEEGFSPLGHALEGLPRWRTRCEAGPPITPAELLLIALAGERGESSYSDPLEAAAIRLADEIEALAGTLAAREADGDGIGTTLHYLAGRARALAELIGVTRLGSAA